MDLVIATKNKKKLREIRELLRIPGLRFLSLADYPRAPRIIENGKTFSENAAKKAIKIARYSGKLTLGEDSGLCVDALGGAPGIYSSRFSGRNKSDKQNNLKLLRLLKGQPRRRRKARYVCAVALADKGGLLAAAEGACPGVIAGAPKGSRGFGYDPLFLIPARKKTFAQLGEKIKHRMSHRYHALRKISRILEKYIEQGRRY